MVWRRSQSFSPIPPLVHLSSIIRRPPGTPLLPYTPPTRSPTPAFTPSASRPLVPAAPTAFPLPTTSWPPIHRHRHHQSTSRPTPTLDLCSSQSSSPLASPAPPTTPPSSPMPTPTPPPPSSSY